MRTRLLLLVVLSSPFTPAAFAEPYSLDRFPLPDRATLRLVGTDLVQNGRELVIATFSSEQPVEDTLAFYRQRWPADDDGPGHVESELEGWRIVSRFENGANVALQLRDESGYRSSGLLSIVDLDSTIHDGGGMPPLPDGASLLSNTSSGEGGRTARTWVGSSLARSGEVAAFYRDRLPRDGWSIVSDRGDGGPTVLLLSRHGAEAELVISPVDDGTSIIVMNQVTGDD